MRRFHLIFGVIVAIVFLLTGQYMDRFHQHLQYMPDGPRMLYRTRHIFILLSGLVHLSLGSYFRFRSGGVRRAIQIVGSVLISIASVLFTIGFFYEPKMTGLYAPYSKRGVIMIAVGTLLHVLTEYNETGHK
jgi:hypothetical protein